MSLIAAGSSEDARLLVRRLKSLADGAGLDTDTLTRIVAHCGECAAPVLELRARRLEMVLTVAGRLLADEREVAEWLRRPNPGLLGMSPLDALVTHEDALRVIRNALVAEYRAAYPDGGF